MLADDVMPSFPIIGIVSFVIMSVKCIIINHAIKRYPCGYEPW